MAGPYGNAGSRSTPTLLTTAVSIFSVAIGLVTAAQTDSVVIGAFWACTAAYAVKTIAGFEPDDLGGARLPSVTRRFVVAGVAVGAAAGTLALTTQAWGRDWTTTAVALTTGTVVHVAAWWIAAPATARSQVVEDLRNPRIVLGPGDVSPGAVAFLGILGTLAAFAGMWLLAGEIWNGLLTVVAVVCAVSAAVGLWARGRIHR